MIGSPASAWFYHFVWRCERRRWAPAFVKGPDWTSDREGERYGQNLSYYSRELEEPYIVNTWRNAGGGWENLGWSDGSC